MRREARDPSEVSWDPAAGTIDAAGLTGVDAAVPQRRDLDRWTAARKREIRDSRVSSTSLLASTVASLEPRPSVFVSAGGVGIYGDRGDEILTEESRRAPASSPTWGAGEAAAEPARTAGIRVVNFRQGVVVTATGARSPDAPPVQARAGRAGRERPPVVELGRARRSRLGYVHAEGDLDGP